MSKEPEMYRIRTGAALAAMLLTLAAGSADAARYRYGGYSRGGQESGVVISLEGGLFNVRNAGVVYGTSESLEVFGGGLNEVNVLIPASEDDFAGRLGVGYQWANGNRLTASYGTFSTETSAAADGPLNGALHYAIGPPISLGGGSFAGDSGSPGSFDLMTATDITAADISFGRQHEIGDEFFMEWSAGVRYATYEEKTGGFYDDSVSNATSFGDNRYDVAKSLEGNMIGARIAARGNFFLSTSFSLSAGVGLSFLDGEIVGSSGLTPTGLVNSAIQPASLSTVNDDGRSGRTTDIDVRITWHTLGDRVRVWFGWEQQDWDSIADDPLRNFPGTAAPLAPRDSIVLSGYRLGASYRF
jgi:hypothetical protein